MNFHLEIITPERKAYEDDIDFLSVPTDVGAIGVLAHHEALFRSLDEGEVKIKKGSQEIFLAIGGGFMEVSNNHVLILVSRAYNATELNETEIKKAQASALELLKQKGKDTDISALLSTIRRSTIELSLLRRHRQRSPTKH